MSAHRWYSKDEAYNKLSKMFQPSHVRAWLDRFPSDAVFNRQSYAGDFVRYINSLDARPVSNLPDPF